MVGPGAGGTRGTGSQAPGEAGGPEVFLAPFAHLLHLPREQVAQPWHSCCPASGLSLCTL